MPAAYQTYDLVEAMLADTGLDELDELRADGGMTNSDLLMQFQADVLGSPVVAPEVAEITATGAAYAAGLAIGFWAGLDELRANYTITHRREPAIGGDDRVRGSGPGRLDTREKDSGRNGDGIAHDVVVGIGSDPARLGVDGSGLASASMSVLRAQETRHRLVTRSG